MSEAGIPAIETVLCAYDFSETSERALEQALRMIRRHGARLVLGHVVEPIPPGPYPVLSAPQDEGAVRTLVVERLEALAETWRERDVDVTVRVELGRPNIELVAIAEDVGADLVVIGTRGLTGLKHLVLGSTAESVVRRCACPVLTVHPDDAVLDGEIETVILPTDLSLDATAAAEAFVSLFRDGTRPLGILTYADQTPPYFQPFRHETLLRNRQRDEVKEAIEAKMAPTVEMLREAGFEIQTAVLDGEPVEVTSALARRRKADLILLSTHGRSAFVNALLGRTAQRIVQHAPCPVLTVRPGSRRSAE